MSLKSRVLYAIIASVLSLSFFSCKNFLNGDGIKSQIEDAVVYSSTPDVSIKILTNNQYGNITSRSDGTYKVGTAKLQLGFAELDTYQFDRWQVYDAEGKPQTCTKDDAIYIKDPKLANTEFAIQKEVKDYYIFAECLPRPAVLIVSPQYVTTGVGKDRAVNITFNKDIPLSNFRYTEEECAALTARNCTLLKDKNNAAYGYMEKGIIYFKNIKIRNADDSSENLLLYFDAPEVNGSVVTIKTKTDAASQIQLGADESKDIQVTVSSSVAIDTACMKENYSWKYRIVNSTDVKASVTFSAYDNAVSMGTLNYQNTHDFSVGECFKVTFEPNEAYGFIKWSVTGNENDALACYENGTELTCTVLGEASIQISPVCEELKQSEILFTSTAGTVSPSGLLKYRRNAEFQLISTPADDYSFTKWIVKNLLTDEIYEDSKVEQFFQFENVYSSSTKVKILQDSANLSIVAATAKGSKVFATTPNGFGTAVDRDTNIRVFFDNGIDEKYLYYTQEEAKAFADAGYTVLCDNPEKSSADDYLHPWGYYKNEDDLASYVFKNIEIKDRSDNTNYLKYYGKPYLSDSTGKVLIIPVKKVKTSGVMDSSKNVPGKREIFVSLGTEYGYESNGALVPISKYNLSWVYKTNADFDTTVPYLNTSKLALKNVDGISYTKNSSLVALNSLNKTWYTDRYVKLSNGKPTVKVELTAVDDKSNLQYVNICSVKMKDSNYDDVSGQTVNKYTLPMFIDGTDGTVDTFIDVTNNQTLNLDEGVYKIYFELCDEVGNTSSSESDNYYYLVIDNTPPEDAGTLRFFYNNGKVRVQKADSNFNKQKDFATQTLKVNGTSKAITADTTFDGLVNGKDVPYVVTVTDIFGNTVDYTYQLNAGVKKGMALYTNGLFSDKSYEELTPSGVVISDDYENILVAEIATYSSDKNAANKEVVKKVTINSVESTYRCPTIAEMTSVYNGLSYLRKWGATDNPDSRTSAVPLEWKTGSTSKKWDTFTGCFYYTSESGNVFVYSRGGEDAKEWISAIKLFNLSTGSALMTESQLTEYRKYLSSYAKYKNAEIYYSDWYTKENSSYFYNVKHVLTFTDN